MFVGDNFAKNESYHWGNEPCFNFYLFFYVKDAYW